VKSRDGIHRNRARSFPCSITRENIEEPEKSLPRRKISALDDESQRMKVGSDDFDLLDCIAAVLRGETDRYRSLVREYGLLVRGFLATRLFHHEDVEDLAQEVFVIAFDKLETFATGVPKKSVQYSML